MITVRDFLQLFEKTLFKAYFVIDDLDKIKEDEKECAQELMEFKLVDFGEWIYGVSNTGRDKGSFVFIIQKEIDGKIFTSREEFDRLKDIKEDDKLMKMEVLKVEEFSLKGRHNISSTRTAWPANEASIVLVVK